MVSLVDWLAERASSAADIGAMIGFDWLRLPALLLPPSTQPAGSLSLFMPVTNPNSRGRFDKTIQEVGGVTRYVYLAAPHI